MAPPPDDKESFASLFEQASAESRGVRRSFSAGEKLEVVVVAIAREAVFVDLGGKQEGVLERGDLVAPDGTLRVEVGSRISAVVRSVDRETGQVSLAPVVVRSATDAEGEGTRMAVASAGGPMIQQGARVKGAVTGIERFGVFVQIAGSTGRAGRGLIPSSETGTPRGADLRKHFNEGQEIEALVLAIDEQGKIRLSINALRTDEERSEFEAFTKGEAAAPAPGERARKAPEPRGFGTLGDLLGKRGGAASTPAAPAPRPGGSAKSGGVSKPASAAEGPSSRDGVTKRSKR